MTSSIPTKHTILGDVLLSGYRPVSFVLFALLCVFHFLCYFRGRDKRYKIDGVVIFSGSDRRVPDVLPPFLPG